jgi:hypothetical protein
MGNFVVHPNTDGTVGFAPAVFYGQSLKLCALCAFVPLWLKFEILLSDGYI